MKKKLILIGGAMGCGKTTLARIFSRSIKETVMLDGDWCWEQGCDWNWTEENKKMVLDNILFLLNNFMNSKTMKNIIFCWVLNLKEIYNIIINTLKESGNEFDVFNISLICDEENLKNRLINRIKTETYNKEYENLIYSGEMLNMAKNRNEELKKLDTIKINTNNKEKEEIFKELIKIVNINNDLKFC